MFVNRQFRQCVPRNGSVRVYSVRHVQIHTFDIKIQKSGDWMSQIKEVHSASVTDPLVAADHFAIGIKMDVTYINDYRAVLDKIGVYEVKEEKIVFEQFFFQVLKQLLLNKGNRC